MQFIAARPAGASVPAAAADGPVRPVRSGGGTEATVGHLERFAVDLANGEGSTAPVVHLGRLTGVDAGKLEQREAAHRILRDFNALPNHAGTRPCAAVLDHQRDTVS